MKTLSAAELVSFCEWLNGFILGAQLQDLWTDGETLVMRMHRSQELFLLIRLAPTNPLMWLQVEKPRVKKSPKPFSLFLASHGRNKFLQQIHVNLAKGRTVVLTFTGRDENCEVEIDLIPKSPNLVVRAQNKNVWWNKPKDLPPPLLPEMTEVERDWETWCDQVREYVFGARSQPSQSHTQSPQNSQQAQPRGPELTAEMKAHLRAIEKKERAIEAMRKQLESNESDRYRQLGEALKMSTDAVGDPNIPEELRDLYDNQVSVIENLQRAFQKAKDIERKRQGTLDRLQILEKEVEKLKRSSGPSSRVTPSQGGGGAGVSIATQAMRKGDASGRKLQVDGFEAVIGKSGADNLAILRQARAWDFWIHLKDEPGAHAILFRNRQQEVPSHVIQKVAEWVWSESRGKKALLGQGKYEVLAVECRFVKPIKGDKLGRVNYSNPRVYTFASKSS